MINKCFYILLSILCAALFVYSSADAQQQPVSVTSAQSQSDQNTAEQLNEAVMAATKESKTFNKKNYPSLVFTYWEHDAILTARASRGSVRDVSDAELMRNLNLGEKEKVKPPPEERDITLGGILYRSKADWAIWLNNKRVTPDALPVEVLDLRVFDEYIEMKWYDEYTEQIFPIRLRPHQRFNIDTRMFLPG